MDSTWLGGLFETAGRKPAWFLVELSYTRGACFCLVCVWFVFGFCLVFVCVFFCFVYSFVLIAYVSLPLLFLLLVDSNLRVVFAFVCEACYYSVATQPATQPASLPPLTMNAVIKSSDMTPEMTTFAVQKAKEGLKKFCTENVRRLWSLLPSLLEMCFSPYACSAQQLLLLPLLLLLLLLLLLPQNTL